ncbi:MAG: OmpA family protein [Lachnospiraceae bacterium]|nr:OmpA family protein [Lachnospiraceae bacterium]
MKFCSKCGVGLEDDAKVCFNCGTPLEQNDSSQQPMLFGGTDISVSDKKENVERTQDAKKKMPIWIPIAVILAVISLVVGVVLLTSGGNGEDKGNDDQQIADNNDTTDENDDESGENAGNADDNSSNDDVSLPSYFAGPDVPDEIREYLFFNEKNEVVEFDESYKKLDSKKVYENLKYIPQMFWGTYELEDADAKKQDYVTYIDKITGEDLGYDKDSHRYDMEIPALPYAISAGPHSYNEALYALTGLYWAELSFYEKDSPNPTYLEGFYEIDGNIFRFTPVNDWGYDENLCKFVFAPSEYVIEYYFEFNGPYLTFTRNGQSITLLADGFHSDVDNKEGISTRCYVDYYSKISFGKIFSLHMCSGYDVYGRQLYITDLTGYCDHNAKIKMTTDGLFTMVWTNNKGVTSTVQLVYFSCGEDGLVLTDGTNTVCYTYNSADYDDIFIEGNVGADDVENIDKIDKEELGALIEKKANLLEDLAKAYQTAGMKVDINQTTGEIALDSTVLFGVNESNISSEGKEFLSKFIKIYCDVVFDAKYEDFITKIMVEGHTDTSGSYALNQKLSQSRADSVKNYCLSADAGINSTYINELADMMIAAGYSYDKPIYDASGKVDMDASRRVAFRFLISLE